MKSFVAPSFELIEFAVEDVMTESTLECATDGCANDTGCALTLPI